MGWNLAALVPGHSRRFTVTHLNFWQPVVRIHVISKTLKWLFGKFEGLIRNIGSGCLFLVSLKLLQASAYHLVLRTFAKLSQEVPSWHCPRFRIFYRTNFCQTATTQIKPEDLNPFELTNPKYYRMWSYFLMKRWVIEYTSRHIWLGYFPVIGDWNSFEAFAAYIFSLENM